MDDKSGDNPPPPDEEIDTSKRSDPNESQDKSQDKSQDNKDDPAPYDANTKAIMDGTAIPSNNDTHFTRMTEPQLAVQSQQRDSIQPLNLDNIVQGTNPVGLFLQMLNRGNTVEMAATLIAQKKGASTESVSWQRVAATIMQIQDSAIFHTLRSRILSPFHGQGDVSLFIQQAKQHILQLPGVPPGIELDHISWDAISFKTYPSAAELLCYRSAKLYEALDQTALATIDEIQRVCHETVIEKCAEFRARAGTRQDEFVPDASIFYEIMIGGAQDEQRDVRIAKVGKGMLLRYIDRMQALFLTGNLPSAVQPSKIFACHDPVTAAELRGSIMSLAEQQISQAAGMVPNANILNRGYKAAIQNTDYTQLQQASINMKKNVDTFQRRAMATMGEDYDRPMANLSNQLAGSANTLQKELEANTQDLVVEQTEEQKQRSKQQLSILLACLRRRADAIQQSDWELMSTDDLDHFEIVKYLAQADASFAEGNDFVYQISAAIQQSYEKGHNLVKFGKNMFPTELMSFVTYSMEGRAKVLARSIPLMNADLKEGGQMFALMMRMVIVANAQKQRILMEALERSMRKTTVQQALTSI